MDMKVLIRCAWLGDDPLMMEYHDTEWGVPLHDDRRHYEFLVLDAMQAGLSWRTVLRKRDVTPTCRRPAWSTTMW